MCYKVLEPWEVETHCSKQYPSKTENYLISMAEKVSVFFSKISSRCILIFLESSCWTLFLQYNPPFFNFIIILHTGYKIKHYTNVHSKIEFPLTGIVNLLNHINIYGDKRTYYIQQELYVYYKIHQIRTEEILIFLLLVLTGESKCQFSTFLFPHISFTLFHWLTYC
jgi:hypothetical protein